LPDDLITWYYSISSVLAALNPRLNQTTVNATCSGQFECLHDYIVRLNPITSGATAVSVNTFTQSRAILGKN
jgi:hypothetical protein